jgi:hypothetical protein
MHARTHSSAKNESFYILKSCGVAACCSLNLIAINIMARATFEAVISRSEKQQARENEKRGNGKNKFEHTAFA